MGQVRILGGRWCGRSLAVPSGVRPVTGRARETLFSMAQARDWLAEARVLDCFAGSGALGLEALSRGAQQADFLETRAKVLKENLSLFCGEDPAPPARLVGKDALKPPPPPDGLAVQLVFADPPWRTGESLYTKCFTALLAQGWIDAKTVLIAFQRVAKPGYSAPPSALEAAPFEVLERRQVGDGEIVFLRGIFSIF